MDTMSYPKLLVTLIFSGLIFQSAAQASVILDSSVTGTPGAYSYAFEIENQTDVGILLLSLTITGDVGAIGAPAGWLDTTSIVGSGETLVEWVSTDTPYDVPASGTLSGFTIASDSGPGTVAFSTFDENFTEFDGQTTGPVASTVPEPTSVALLGTSLVAIYFRRRFIAGKFHRGL